MVSLAAKHSPLPALRTALRGWLGYIATAILDWVGNRGLRSQRVGAFRIIYQLAEDGKTVRVMAIRHRSVAYGRDPR